MLKYTTMTERIDFDLLERQVYNIPARGQIMLLPSVRGEWGLGDTTHHVEMADIGPAVAVVPDATSWNCLRIYPKVQALKEEVFADSYSSGVDTVAREYSWAALPPFTRYRVHNEGKVSVPSTALEKWGMHGTPGKVEQLNLGKIVLLSPISDTPKRWKDIDRLISSSLRTVLNRNDASFTVESWQIVHERLCTQLGSKILRSLMTSERMGGLNLTADQSLLGQAIGKHLVYDTLAKAEQLVQ